MSQSNVEVTPAIGGAAPESPAIARVLHLINGEHYSGAERVQDLLAGSLGEFGFPVSLACVKPGRFAGSYRSRRARLYLSPMRGKLDLRPVGPLARLVRRERFGLIHAHTPRTVLLGAAVAALTGVPLVYHVHSPAARESAAKRNDRVNAWVERWSLWRASAVIAVSQSLARWMDRFGRADRPVVVVYNGVPCRVPRPPRPASASEWTLGTVALFRPRKGLEVLLDAVAEVRSQGYPVRLRAVGDFQTPGYRRAVQGHAASLGLAGAVDWVGFVHDVDRELDRMDLVVVPSLFGEGLPMVVLEAMAAGVPVVATRVEGIPEVIRDGQEGLLAEPGSARSLAGCLLRVVRGEVDWQALRTAALARQARHFSDRSMAAGVAEVYRRILSRGR
jgi:glycosyltransferase involved in cell wall biosynthesis